VIPQESQLGTPSPYPSAAPRVLTSFLLWLHHLLCLVSLSGHRLAITTSPLACGLHEGRDCVFLAHYCVPRANKGLAWHKGMLGVREGIVESLGVEGCFENTYFLFPGLEVERRFGLPISLITSSGGRGLSN
jgi:hypothetical protein